MGSWGDTRLLFRFVNDSDKGLPSGLVALALALTLEDGVGVVECLLATGAELVDAFWGVLLVVSGVEVDMEVGVEVGVGSSKGLLEVEVEAGVVVVTATGTSGEVLVSLSVSSSKGLVDRLPRVLVAFIIVLKESEE
jgi:hypothetical protein